MIEIEESQGIYRIRINQPLTPVDFPFSGTRSSMPLESLGLSIKEGNPLTLIKPLHLKEHVVGLGEKAFELDRRRRKYVMYNVDAGAYNKYSDPLYLNIPFFITIYGGEATGYFFNSASKLVIDVGQSEYDKVKVEVPEGELELFVFQGPKIKDVLERYSKLTGLPYLPPKWALGYMISRFSYFPQERIIEMVDALNKDGFKVTGVFLDIDFMDNFKLFTWHPERFPNPNKLIEELHLRDVKVITIVDHSVRADQGYDVFLSGLQEGVFCETEREDLFVGKLWAGNCVYPDFFQEKARKWWENLIAKWTSQGIDGIWLDMNEPTDFTKLFALREIKDCFKESPFHYVFPHDVVHTFKGKKVKHDKLRNAYPYYEAMATYEGMTKVSSKPFILSRSGFAGIQRYAGVWTGDNTSSWNQLRLQLQLVLGISISGVPYVGIDIGGFQGREFPEIENSPEILVRQFQLALFFPFFRTHKNKDGVDTEPIYLPSFHKERVRKVFETRYSFLPYIYSLAEEAHRTGHPIIRPLFYDFQEDEDSYKVEDEYMVGSHVLYAPNISPSEERYVYLPPGRWADFWSGEVMQGWVKTRDELPIYVREGSVLLLSDGEIVLFGEGRTKVDNVLVEYTGGTLRFSAPTLVRSIRVLGKGEVLEVGREVNEVKL
ncbi:glycoside hydrolase family 31 protein [Metallosphaera tengchongensis]|uniref:Glycoside hydrolase family 31 protein n=1 Tax=Metallosphaera tengchongensis TaxID=1532350 RepID=A0A6N0NV63_9CREN|nr:alpha-glucosidase MalA [Metallosphaera tengchongensis]QKQ99020.1 glycoside hydrolase family 31 protein [Metallosphaera tengchongensis]